MVKFTDRDELVVKEAKQLYADDDLEIDDDAKVSRMADEDHPDQVDGEIGAWVAAWVWVPFEGGQ